MGRDHLGAPVKSKDDPDGIYFMTEGNRYENFGEENEKKIPTRWIKKYIYLKKYDIYINDADFADYGTLEMDYDDFDTSGYILESEDADSVYNKGKVEYVYGGFYKDKNGKNYICEVDYSSEGENKLVVYDYEEFPELKTASEQKYICIPVSGVDGNSLTRVYVRKNIEGESNFYINDKDFKFNNGDDTTSSDTMAIGKSSDTEKKANPVTVKTAVKSVKAKALKSKKQTVKPLTIKKNQGKVTVTYVKKGTAKKLQGKVTVSKKGAVTIKKGKYSKGTYKIKLKISVKGNSKYKAKTITKTVTVKIK